MTGKNDPPDGGTPDGGTPVKPDQARTSGEVPGSPAFNVLRRHATEAPFSSPLDREKRNGTYACAGCGLELFTSAMKFDSGTGWPSFFDHIPGAIGTRKDYTAGMVRTEYHCAQCSGHQGHVFTDGPAPTGLRYCNNGIALVFTPS